MATSIDSAALRPGYPRHDITGVVLAGGRARRMGGEDKGLVLVDGEAMVVHALRGLKPQTGTLLINANRNRARYAELGDCSVVADADGDYAGPLAGMASAMQRATTRYILTVPCDSPLLAPDLGERLFGALVAENAEICVAHDGKRMQPVFALLDCTLRHSIVAYLGSGGRKIDTWYAQRHIALADLRDHPDMFLNINTPEDRDLLESRLAGKSRC
jgi:molybdopterin-guanine dinucleotide biosynthesis protein A